MRLPPTGTMAISAGAIALAARALFEARHIEITRTELSCERLPVNFDGFVILHLSDLHTTKYGQLERKMARMLSNLHAHIAVLTGDIAGSVSGVEHLCRLISDLPAEEVFAIFGNSENGYPRIGRRVAEELPRHGVRLLRNANERIQRGGQSIVIAGVEDPFTHNDNLRLALAGVAKDEFVLLLAHSPGIANEVQEAGVDLVLSGHTHGGQLKLPFLPAPYVHMGWGGPRFESGLYSGRRLSNLIRRDAGRMHVYVSRGLGASYFPARLFCRPEIALLTLSRG